MSDTDKGSAETVLRWLLAECEWWSDTDNVEAALAQHIKNEQAKRPTYRGTVVWKEVPAHDD